MKQRPNNEASGHIFENLLAEGISKVDCQRHKNQNAQCLSDLAFLIFAMYNPVKSRQFHA